MQENQKLSLATWGICCHSWPHETERAIEIRSATQRRNQFWMLPGEMLEAWNVFLWEWLSLGVLRVSRGVHWSDRENRLQVRHPRNLEASSNHKVGCFRGLIGASRKTHRFSQASCDHVREVGIPQWADPDSQVFSSLPLLSCACLGSSLSSKACVFHHVGRLSPWFLEQAAHDGMAAT